jgi:hypothetical protein
MCIEIEMKLAGLNAALQDGARAVLQRYLQSGLDQGLGSHGSLTKGAPWGNVAAFIIPFARRHEMRRILGGFAILSLLMFATPDLSAKDLAGKFGLGYESTLGGVSGLDLLYYINRHLALEGVLSMDYVSADPDSPMIFGMTLGGRYNFARAKDANLGLGVRVNIGYGNSDRSKILYGKTEDESIVHFNIEVPIILEYFLSNHFSISTKVGLLIDVIPEKGPVLTPGGVYQETLLKEDTGSGDTTRISFGAPGLIGALGATFYF